MIKKFIKKLITWATKEEIENISLGVRASSPGARLNLGIINAVGGKIVEVSYYVSATNTHYEKSYLIHDNEDFSKALEYIISVENILR